MLLVSFFDTFFLSAKTWNFDILAKFLTLDLKLYCIKYDNAFAEEPHTKFCI
jgi:hypothetical protein